MATLEELAAQFGGKEVPSMEATAAKFGGTVAPTQAPAEPETTAEGVTGAVTRGLAPTAAGALLGGAIGGPPGAVIGGGAMALTQLVGDPVVDTLNTIFGTSFTKPTDAIEGLLTRLGVSEPKTSAERIIQATASGAGSAYGTSLLGQTLSGAPGLTGEVGKALASEPAINVAGGIGGGAASQASAETGGGVVEQIASGIAGGMMGAKAGQIGVRATTPVKTPAMLAAERAGIPVMTSDVAPPQTFASKWLRDTGEKIPITGTGGPRAAQQAKRVQAITDLIEEFGASRAGLADDIMDDLAKTRGDDVKRYAGMKNEVIERLSGQEPKPKKIAAELKIEPIKPGDYITDKGGQILKANPPASSSFFGEGQIAEESGIRTATADDVARQKEQINVAKSAIEKQNAQAMEDWTAKNTVDVSRTVSKINSEIGRLSSLNTDEVSPVIAILEDWKQAVQSQDLKNIELLRKQLGESFKSPEMASVRSTGEKALSSIYGALREDMGDYIKATGKSRDYAKWKLANARLAEMQGELDQRTLKSVLKTGNATPEDVNKLLFSQKPSDVRALYRNLSPEGRANARSAIIAKAAEKAGDNISPEKFANEVKRLGASIEVFFSNDDLERVTGLAKALDLTRRASQAGVTPPTGVQVALPVGAAALTTIFGGPIAGLSTLASTGLMARAFESKPVRDILVRLANTTNPTEEAALAKRFISAVQAMETETPKPGNRESMKQKALGPFYRAADNQ